MVVLVVAPVVRVRKARLLGVVAARVRRAAFM